jgi:hypothetical protein
MDLNGADLEQIGEVDRRVVDPPIKVETARWSIGSMRTPTRIVRGHRNLWKLSSQGLWEPRFERRTYAGSASS